MSSRAYLLIILLLTSTVVPALAGQLPGTPSGQRAGEVIALLNGTSALDLDEYIQDQYAPGFREAFPLATHKAIFTTTQTMFGRLRVAGITESAPGTIKVVLKAESKDAWLNLFIQIEPDEPHRIVSMGLSPGARPENLGEAEDEVETPGEIGEETAPRSNTQFSDLEGLEKYLGRLEERNEFSGAVLIARDGSPIFQGAYGYASKRFGVPNTLDTKFNLGSCNKIFTAVAIAQLIEKGELSLDDPIGLYLDMFSREIAERVTVRHLLNMRSGWGDYWSDENFLNNITRLRHVPEYLEFIKNIPLDFEPGTNFQHSNTGFIVAGAIIEALSGMDYYEYIRHNIYGPAGMMNTDSYDKDGPVENLAMGYTNMNASDKEGEGYRWNNMYSLPPRGTPTGGGYSTVTDLLKFGEALREFKLMSRGSTVHLLHRFEGSPGDSMAFPQKPYRFVGAAPGICAFVAFDFRSSYSVIVLSNYDFPTGMTVGTEILEMLEIQ